MNAFLRKLGITLPIIQAPMAGTSTPTMAAAVCNAGALGSIGVGAVDAVSAAKMINDLRAATNLPFNVNVFCHRPPTPSPQRNAAWIACLAPEFHRFDAEPPLILNEIYKSFVTDDAMFEMMLQTRPAVVSFHFGLPPAAKIAALRNANIILLASATHLHEAKQIADAGIDAVVAQGYEAGGHRGVFDPDARDERIGTLALMRLLARELSIPVIAAGGIMDGASIATVLKLGASAAQLGTAFITCPESSADAAYRAALLDRAHVHTVMTAGISGRPARCIANRFTALTESVPAHAIAPYPMAYDAGKALNAAAKAKNETGYGALWAGQAAPLARAMQATELVALLRRELDEALRN